MNRHASRSILKIVLPYRSFIISRKHFFVYLSSNPRSLIPLVLRSRVVFNFHSIILRHAYVTLTYLAQRASRSLSSHHVELALGPTILPVTPLWQKVRTCSGYNYAVLEAEEKERKKEEGRGKKKVEGNWKGYRIN